MSRRKVGEVLWLALQYAKQDRLSLVNAYHGDKSESAVRDALADVRAFESLQMRLFGTTRSEREAMVDAMRPVSLFKMLAEGESFDTANEDH